MPEVARFRSFAAYLEGPRSVRHAMRVIVVATIVTTLAGGLLAWVFDREDFATLGDAMWWALQTVTTVGYGDVAPTHVGGRLVGALVMLEGTAFIAIVTAVITSIFVARATRDSEAARLEADVSDRERLERRFDELERKLDDLLAATRDSSGN